MKRLLVVAFVVSGLMLSTAALAMSGNGTWVGKLPNIQGPDVPSEERIPLSAFPAVKLVVTPATAVATFHGRTQAAHDSPTSMSTCVMTFHFFKAEQGWRYYRTTGKSALIGPSTGGVPDLSPCNTNLNPQGYLRLRPAGAKLKVEYTYRIRLDREPFVPSSRGYLHR